MVLFCQVPLRIKGLSKVVADSIERYVERTSSKGVELSRNSDQG